MEKYIKKFFQKFWDFYPKGALVYICSHNGVTGAVRAEDYDNQLREMRNSFNKNGWPRNPVRPHIYPVFLFSDKKYPQRDFRCGTQEELNSILRDCLVEFHDFHLPQLAPAPTEVVDKRNNSWSLEQANTYLHGGKISAYSL